MIYYTDHPDSSFSEVVPKYSVADAYATECLSSSTLCDSTAPVGKLLASGNSVGKPKIGIYAHWGDCQCHFSKFSFVFLRFCKDNCGWWQYDERTSLELEGAYKRGERSCELLIAGFLYVADFDGMAQLRRGDPSRRRRIKRDLASIPVKGVAGLRTSRTHGNAVAQQTQPVSAEDQCFPPSSRHGNHYGSTMTTPPTPVNTPGSTTPPGASHSANASSSSSLRRVVEEMGRLQLTDDSNGVASSPPQCVGGGEEEEEGSMLMVGGVARSAVQSVLWSPVSPDVASPSPWVLTLSSDEDQL